MASEHERLEALERFYATARPLLVNCRDYFRFHDDYEREDGLSSPIIPKLEAALILADVVPAKPGGSRQRPSAIAERHTTP
jgi:hypothetical protein